MITKEAWELAQKGEILHWTNENQQDTICNGELHGQIVGYAKYLGIESEYLINNNHDINDYSSTYYLKKRYNLQNKSVIDIGGGPTSLLLRCTNFKRAVVVDPLPVNDIVKKRYKLCGIELVQLPAEEYVFDQVFDETWVYNCLHHVMNPTQILENIKLHTKLLRIYEILHTNIDYMHPNSFTKEFFDNVLGVGGLTKNMDEPAPSPRGIGYYGKFNYQL